MGTIEKQVYICMNGPENQVIQTTIETYNTYYKLLGWELMGGATPLPGMKGATYPDQVKTEEPAPVVESIGCQRRLF